VSFLNRTVAVVLGSLLTSCGGEYHTLPVFPTPAASTPPPGSTQWSGTLEFTSARAPDSCVAAYLASHSDLLAQSASGDLQISGDSARMTLRTSGGQNCVGNGMVVDSTLTLTTRHETCGGFPIPRSVIIGLLTDCHAFDPIGDGPFWGSGTVSAHIAGSEIDGHWMFDVFDPSKNQFTIDLGVHLRSQ